MFSKFQRSLEIVLSVPNPHILFLLPFPHTPKTTLQLRKKKDQVKGVIRVGDWPQKDDCSQIASPCHSRCVTEALMICPQVEANHRTKTHTRT